MTCRERLMQEHPNICSKCWNREIPESEIKEEKTIIQKIKEARAELLFDGMDQRSVNDIIITLLERGLL